MNWKAKLVYNFTAAIAPVLSRIIPKKRNYFVFAPTHDTKKMLSGNCKALLLYLQKNHPEIDCALVLTFNRNIPIPEEQNGLAVKRSTVQVYWSILRAQHVITDSLVFDPLLAYGKHSIIQLWHGIGFKNVCFLTSQTRRYLKIAKKLTKQYKLIVSSSESNSIQQNASFKIKRSIVTGYPRNDVFFKNNNFSSTLRKKYQVEYYDKVISYAPTFRETVTTDPFTEKYWNKLNTHLAKNNEVFIVKKHPWDEFLKVPNNFSNIKDLTSSTLETQELLLITDILISDYSSIITDFAITGKPILTYAYDFDQYIKQVRSMYYDLEKTLPQPIVQREEDLLEKIKDRSWQEDPVVQKSYENFKKTFHKYLDGNSSKRVTEEILKL